jgi:hypothetical protein
MDQVFRKCLFIVIYVTVLNAMSAPTPPGGVSKVRAESYTPSSCNDSNSTKFVNGAHNFCSMMSSVDSSQKLPFNLFFKVELDYPYAHTSKKTFTRIVSTYALYDTAKCWSGSCTYYGNPGDLTPNFTLDPSCGAKRLDSAAYDSTTFGYAVSATPTTINALAADTSIRHMEMTWETCPDAVIRQVKKPHIASIRALIRELHEGALKNAKITIYAIDGKILPLSIFSSSARHNETIIVRIIQNNQEYTFKDVLIK